MTTRLRQLLRLVPIVFGLAFVLGYSTPAHAQQIRCNEDLRICYFRAAQADSIWNMWAMGADCELTFVDCVRRALIGK